MTNGRPERLVGTTVRAVSATGDGVPAAPAVDICPPRWFGLLAVAAAVFFAVLGAVVTAAKVAGGEPLTALLSLLAGVGLAALLYDVSTRRATSHDDVLVLHQWYRTVTLQRDDIFEFAAARASFLRWDIVAIPDEGSQTRLWVTRMLPAGRSRRQRWLQELEAWRTWIGSRSAWPFAPTKPPAPPDPAPPGSLP